MINQNEGGKIINFSSAVAFNGLVGCADYAAAKEGVISITKALAKELGPYICDGGRGLSMKGSD